MLDEALRTQLQTYLAHLKGPVELVAHLDDSAAAAEIRELLAELVAGSALISMRDSGVSVPAPEQRVPAFGIAKPGQPARVHFAGLPLGHEFTSLVLALLHVSGHPPKISADSLAAAESLNTPMHFETYFSASCQLCPEVVQSLNILAARSASVSHVAVDGALFQAEVEKREILAVPSVYLNGELFGQGRMELEELLAKLDKSVAERTTKALSDKGVFDMLIVGGGPAGAAAAVYGARKGIAVGMVADRFGGQVADTMGIENFISVLETEGPKLVTALEQHAASYAVDIMKHQRAKRITPGATFAVELESGATLHAKSLIIATGARWRDMGVPGENEYRTRGVTYCPHCDGPLFKGKRVAVIGGGNSGVEAAIDLAGVVAHVTLLEFAPELKADEILKRKLRSMPNVEIITQARTTEVRGDGSKAVGLTYENRASGELVQLDVAGIFVQIGLLPNTDFLKGTVDLTKFGEIIVNAKGETSAPGIFAAGDVTTTPYKQIIIAAGDGAKAALGAFEHLIHASAPAA
jgi:NADH-dependent peroxiredoxin subunit F